MANTHRATCLAVPRISSRIESLSQVHVCYHKKSVQRCRVCKDETHTLLMHDWSKSAAFRSPPEGLHCVWTWTGDDDTVHLSGLAVPNDSQPSENLPSKVLKAVVPKLSHIAKKITQSNLNKPHRIHPPSTASVSYCVLEAPGPASPRAPSRPIGYKQGTTQFRTHPRLNSRHMTSRRIFRHARIQ